MTHSSVLFVARANIFLRAYFSSRLARKLIEAWEVFFVCVCHNGHQLFGIGYHFKMFRSQVATGKKN